MRGELHWSVGHYMVERWLDGTFGITFVIACAV
jgi:hypothetical protein